MIVVVSAPSKFGQAWWEFWHGGLDELPDGMPSTFNMTASSSPGRGRKLQRQIERLRALLLLDGYDVRKCVVGRKRQLVKAGHLPESTRAEQDQWGLAAVVHAVKAGHEIGGGEGSGDRESLRPSPPALPPTTAQLRPRAPVEA